MESVYIVRAGQQYYKVGKASNVRSRISQLQMNNPAKVELVASKILDNKSYDIEQELHASLVKMAAEGANEWFVLEPQQVVDLCVKLSAYPDVDISERATLSKLVQQQKSMQKTIDKKLDYVINTYQKLKVKPVERKQEPEQQPQFIKPSREDLDEDLMYEAMQVFRQHQRASTSLLQLELRIGYSRAARIVKLLEKKKYISPQDGSRPRRVLV